jgi:hypothetical protein
MFAVKNTANDGRYTSVTRMHEGRTVRCPTCNEVYVLYTRTAELVNSGCALLLEYLIRECPRHIEFVASDARGFALDRESAPGAA